MILKKKHSYKNGGASYGVEGLKASIYCGPRMFVGGAPDEVDLGAVNLATPDSASVAKTAQAAQAKADKEKAKVERLAAREAKKAENIAACEAKKVARAAAKEVK